MADYRNLEVWQLARELVPVAYQLAALLPTGERFNLCSQIQRAAVSIPSNLAEGAGRGSDPEMLRFTRTAIGSLNELETLVTLARDLDFELGELAGDFERRARNMSVKLRNLEGRLGHCVNQQKYVREEQETYLSDPDEVNR